VRNLFWLAAGVAMVLTAQAFANESKSRALYVSIQGTKGATGTKDAPLKSIQAAIEKARPGDTINVLAGKYRGTVTLSKSGEKGKPITLKAVGKVVVDPRKDPKDHGHGIVGRGVGHWVISGFEIVHYQQGIKFKDGHDIVVRGCNVHGGHSGVALEGTFAKNLIFEDIEAHHNVGGGFDVAVKKDMEDVTYRRCQAHHNGCKGGSDGFGISHHVVTRNVRFEKCSAYENGSDGFDLSGRKGHGVTVVGCEAHGNGTKMWGSNFKCWNPGSVFINCVAWKSGKDADPNFNLNAANISCIYCTSGENAHAGFSVSAPGIRIINCIIAHSKKITVLVKKNKSREISVTIENCLIHDCGSDGPAKVGANGNISGDPKFFDAKKGDYRIKRGSAAAGKAKPNKDVQTDRAGKKRPKDAPATGAYEPAEKKE